jgi:peptidoglycan hydrolase-like protein with peptidoglycan-binding domain
MRIDWKRVQRRLTELGFDPGPHDGIRGPKTDAALVAFKRSIGLRARPYLGPVTMAALFEVVPTAKDRSPEGGALPCNSQRGGIQRGSVPRHVGNTPI